MKTIVYVFTGIMLFSMIACSGKKAEETEPVADNDVWPEMDEFHMILAESFHPFKDSANIDPAIANAAEMAKVAEKWFHAPLPQKVDTRDVKASLEQLKIETASFAQLVQAGDTVEIGISLTSLHDRFHTLQEAWYGGGENEHEH